jgi:hypothetical protein
MKDFGLSNTRRLGVAILGAAALVMAFGCGEGTSPDTAQSEFVPPGDLIGTFRYVLSPDSLHYYPDTAISCKDSVLMRESPGKGITMGISIRNDTLILGAPPTRTKDSSAYVQHLAMLTRKTGATGLEGFWKLSGHGYRVLSGTLSAAEKDSKDRAQAWMDSLEAFSNFHYGFEGGFLKMYADVEYAAMYKKTWALFDPVTGKEVAGNFDIEVRRIGKHEAEMKGGKTGETVTITFQNNGTKEYSSSDPSHPTHRYSVPPLSCPNPVNPAWYSGFLIDNLKSAP